MKRRAFLRGVGAAGGAALAVRWPRIAGAARGGAHERLKRAAIAVTARLTPPPAAPAGGAGELSLGAWGGAGGGAGVSGTSARRTLHAGTLALRAVAAGRETVDLFLTFRARTAMSGGALSLALDFGHWSVDHYVVLPGACYAGNRFASRFVGYPPLLTEPADIGPHVPPIVTDIPRLNLYPGPSRLEIAASDLATPAAAVFAPTARLGIVLLVDPTTSIGRTGLGIIESDDRARASIAVGTPFIDQARRGPADAAAPRDPPFAARPGQSITLRARVVVFDCASVGALYERLFALRKALTGPTARPNTLPFSAAFAAHEARVNVRFVEKKGFFALGGQQSAYATWQNGWCGGLAQTLPLLAAGDKRSRGRARRTIDFALAGQARSGFFHGVSDGTTWYDDGFTAPLPPGPPNAWPPRAPPYQHPRWHLVRRSADTLTFLLRQLALLDRQAAGRRKDLSTDRPRDLPSAGDPAWAKAARRCADALARLWVRNRQLGQFVDIDSGDLIVGGSSSAGLAPAGLALAADYFREPRYLKIAQEMGLHYFERFVDVGLTCGGPGDALQCPDGESATALLESFMTLFEATRDRVWVDRARAAAHLLASWVVSYDTPPAGPACPPARLRATGGVLTDAQSRTGAPGYVLGSGAALFRLYRATGEVALLELLRDTVHNLAQYLPAAGHEGPLPAGAHEGKWPGRCARADTSGWLDATDRIMPPDGVFDTIGLLAYTELPSVYAQTDAPFVFVFDHIEARVKERLAGRLVVSLRNPTAAPATLRLYSESAADAALPLRPGAVLGAPKAVVRPGETIEVAMPPLGSDQ